jgi:glutamine transport system substrate-binding protein
VKKHFSITALLITILLVVGLAGCGGKQAASTALHVGTEATYAPFEFQDENSKDYVGFDMDIARAIGRQLGMTVEVKNVAFDGLIPALDAGNIDMVIAAMSITDERKQKVAFSNPYYNSGLIIAVKNDNVQIKSQADLVGKKIAVQIGTTGADFSRKVNGARVTEFNSITEAFLELNNGGVDTVVNDLPVTAEYIKKAGKDIKMVGEVMNSEAYGIAVKKSNTELQTKINKALDELKKNGEYDKIYEKWFGQAPKK